MKKYFKVLATAVLVATMFGIDKTDNTTFEETNVSKVDFSCDFVNKFIDKEDPVYIRREGDIEPRLTRITKTYMFKEKKEDPDKVFRDDKTFYEGINGCHYEYRIIGSIVNRWEGVYCFFTNLIRASVLESGSASYEGNYVYSTKNFYSNSIYYNEKICIELESTINSIQNLPNEMHLGTIGLTNNFKTSTHCTRENKSTYYKELSESSEEHMHFELNSNSVKYCPNAYNIGIGLIGTYYEFSVECYKYKNWWGKDHLASTTVFNCVIANESSFAISYVYTKNANSIEYYYPSR